LITDLLQHAVQTEDDLLADTSSLCVRACLINPSLGFPGPPNAKYRTGRLMTLPEFALGDYALRFAFVSTSSFPYAVKGVPEPAVPARLLEHMSKEVSVLASGPQPGALWTSSPDVPAVRVGGIMPDLAEGHACAQAFNFFAFLGSHIPRPPVEVVEPSTVTLSSTLRHSPTQLSLSGS
jgi:hypothetical protein